MKLNSAWWHRATIGVAIGLFATIIPSTSASAACPVLDSTCQLGFVVQENGSQDVKGDGVYAEMRVEALDVPLDRGGYPAGRGTNTGGNATVVGHNVRGIQVNDSTFRKQFWQIGYTMGLGRRGSDNTSGYTGVNAQNGVYKKVFRDGQYCNNSQNAACTYFIKFYTVLSVDDPVHRYQVQRNVLSNGPAYRFWFDGRLIDTRFEPMAMDSVIGAIAERSAGVGANSRDEPLNMQQDAFSNFQYHVRGTASSEPPGDKNYRRPFGGANAYRAFGNIRGVGCGLTPIPAAVSGTWYGFKTVGNPC